jgi:predicted dehydrogenase
MVKPWNQLSVLIVGCGSIGKRHARVLHSLNVSDVRACDPMPEQRQALSAESPTVKIYESYEAGLADRPDTVLLCTPPAMHIPMASQAIWAGCHVLTEKPLSTTTDGIDQLVAFADEHRKKVMVALCFRYHEGLVRAKKALDSGCIGRLVSIRALMGEHLPDVRPDYRSLYLAKYNGAFELMHDLDLALWYASQPVKSLHAVHGSYSDIGIEAPDVVEFLIDFEDRCTATVHLDFFQQPRRRQMELIGTKGTVTVEFARWDHCTVSVYETSRREWIVEELSTDRDDMFRAEDQDFLECVANDRDVACSIAEGRRSLDAVIGAQAICASTFGSSSSKRARP